MVAISAAVFFVLFLLFFAVASVLLSIGKDKDKEIQSLRKQLNDFKYNPQTPKRLR
jgi:hypothetical protein